MNKSLLFDKKRSTLSPSEIKKYKGEITKQRNSSVCKDLTTFEVTRIGVEAMKKDGFKITKEKLDV